MAASLLHLNSNGFLWDLVERFLGWLPLLVVLQAGRKMRMTAGGRQLIMKHQRALGLRLPAVVDLPPRVHVQLLSAMALGPVLHLDGETHQTTARHGFARCMTRVVIRHMRQDPARPWRLARGKPVRLEELDVVLGATPLAPLTTWLENHGESFEYNHLIYNGWSRVGASAMLMEIEVNSFWVVVYGFEVMFRVTLARPLGLSQSPDSSVED